MTVGVRKWRLLHGRLGWILIFFILSALLIGGKLLQRYGETTEGPWSSTYKEVGHDISIGGVVGLTLEFILMVFLLVHINEGLKDNLVKELRRERESTKQQIESLQNKLKAEQETIKQQIESLRCDLEKDYNAVYNQIGTYGNTIETFVMEGREMLNSRYRSLTKQIKNVDLMQVARNSGITKVLKGPDFQYLLKMAEEGDVITIKNTYINDADMYRDLIGLAATSGVKVRILVLRHTSQAAADRAAQLKRPVHIVKDQIKLFTKQMKDLAETLQSDGCNNLEIREYSESPNYPAFILAKAVGKYKTYILHTSMFVSQPTEPNFQHLRYEWGDVLTNVLSDVERLWDENDPVKVKLKEFQSAQDNSAQSNQVELTRLPAIPTDHDSPHRLPD